MSASLPHKGFPYVQKLSPTRSATGMGQSRRLYELCENQPLLFSSRLLGLILIETSLDMNTTSDQWSHLHKKRKFTVIF